LLDVDAAPPRLCRLYRRYRHTTPEHSPDSPVYLLTPPPHRYRLRYRYYRDAMVATDMVAAPDLPPVAAAFTTPPPADHLAATATAPTRPPAACRYRRLDVTFKPRNYRTRTVPRSVLTFTTVLRYRTRTPHCRLPVWCRLEHHRYAAVVCRTLPVTGTRSVCRLLRCSPFRGRPVHRLPLRNHRTPFQRLPDYPLLDYAAFTLLKLPQRSPRITVPGLPPPFITTTFCYVGGHYVSTTPLHITPAFPHLCVTFRYAITL